MRSISVNRFIAGAAVVFGAFFMTSCDEDLLKVNVPLEYTELTFVIPQTSMSGTLSDSVEVVTNIDSILNSKNVSKNNIKSITLTSLTLEMIDGDSLVNFGVLESVKGELKAGSLNYITIADLPSNPDVVTYSLNVPVSNTELKEYLSQSAFKFKLTTTTRRPVAHDVTVKARLKFNLDAGV